MAPPRFVAVTDPRPPRPTEYLTGYSHAMASMASVGYVCGLLDAQRRWGFTLRINRLIDKRLSKPLDVFVEPDDYGYIAKTPDLPLYGFGEDRAEAIAMLQREIESLYGDLSEGGDFGDDWSYARDFLEEIVVAD